MKVKFRSVEYIYDQASDHCEVRTASTAEAFENPIIGFNRFISEMSSLLSKQLKNELETNGRSRWTGEKQ